MAYITVDLLNGDLLSLLISIKTNLHSKVHFNYYNALFERLFAEQFQRPWRVNPSRLAASLRPVGVVGAVGGLGDSGQPCSSNAACAVGELGGGCGSVAAGWYNG